MIVYLLVNQKECGGVDVLGVYDDLEAADIAYESVQRHQRHHYSNARVLKESVLDRKHAEACRDSWGKS